MSGTWERLDTRKIATGLGLAAFGIVVFLVQLDYLDWENLWKVWPMWIGFNGLGKLAAHPSRRDLSGGLTTLALCAFCFALTYGWGGLTWRNAWPLAIVLLGIAMVVGSLRPKSGAARAVLGEKEDRS